MNSAAINFCRACCFGVIRCFISSTEVVNQHQIKKSRFVETGGEGTANKSSGSCDCNHGVKVRNWHRVSLRLIPMKQVTITRRARFNAAHKLWNEQWDADKNFEVFGKCANPNWHGHNYEVYVTVRGAIDEDTGYFINFTDLKAMIRKYVEEPLDHKNLNMDVPWLKGRQTSVENLVIGIWEQLEPIVSQNGCSLERVRVFETENNYADYYGES